MKSQEARFLDTCLYVSEGRTHLFVLPVAYQKSIVSKDLLTSMFKVRRKIFRYNLTKEKILC